jgi:hemerythrin superfamily protein
MPDVVDLIIQDHRELQRLFEELKSNPEKRPALAPVMTTLLYAHSRAEEQEVYPATRDAGAQDDIEHSQKEHLEADQLAEKVSQTDPESADFSSALEELVSAVSHHIEEEESSVLPKMRELMGAPQLQDLADRFLRARSEHLGDQPEDLTKGDMEQQAANIGMSVGDASKDELQDKLEEEAET